MVLGGFRGFSESVGGFWALEAFGLWWVLLEASGALGALGVLDGFRSSRGLSMAAFSGSQSLSGAGSWFWDLSGRPVSNPVTTALPK